MRYSAAGDNPANFLVDNEGNMAYGARVRLAGGGSSITTMVIYAPIFKTILSSPGRDWILPSLIPLPIFVVKILLLLMILFFVLKIHFVILMTLFIVLMILFFL